MRSNWPVTYRAPRGGRGVGPFARFLDVWSGGPVYFANGLPIPDGHAFLEDVANRTAFAPTPGGCELQVQPGLDDYIDAHLPERGQVPLLVMVGRCLREGPKVFRPRAAQCEPLEQVALALTADDCHIPYSTCVVEFPQDYQTSRIVPYPETGGPGAGELVRPEFAVVSRENGVVVVALSLSPTPRKPERAEYIVGVSGGCFEDALQNGPFAPFVRAAVNFLLLATGNMRQLGPDDPRVAQELAERLRRAKGRGRTPLVRRLKAEIRRTPTVCGLAQEIRLFDRAPAPSVPDPEADGVPMRPHWRKGHWRLAPTRIGRKAVFIRPVLVNGHLIVNG